MRYVSTRGAAPVLDFADALLVGLASDGGLYVPEAWPQLPDGGTGDYVATAVEVMAPFVGDSIDADAFAAMVADSYACFDADDVAPLVLLQAVDDANERRLSRTRKPGQPDGDTALSEDTFALAAADLALVPGDVRTL